ncbi:MAG: efflux transporter outer membrane subunit [Candidatus Competibacteraceae bacterium]|nr:efflux transporter outer membrane subunit [Candidatus Competibacteraceae bacterium]
MLAVTACTTVGPNFDKPEAPIAEDWLAINNSRVSSNSADFSHWWQIFNDPALNALVQTAYQQNLSLRIAGLRILESRAQLGIAAGSSYPQLQQLRAGATSINGSENLANTSVLDLNYWNFNVGIDAAWELDFWGKFQRVVQSADAALIASIADYDDVLVTITAEVARSYTTIRTLEERLKLAQGNIKIQQRSLRIAEVRFRNGVVTELDVQQARALLNNTKALIPQLTAGLRQAKNALSILLGKPPNELKDMLNPKRGIPQASTEIAIGIPAELLRRRPDVRRAEFQAAAQSARIGVATADLYPSFSLTGSMGLRASANADLTATGNSGFSNLFEADSFELLGGAFFRWDIFNYGRIKNKVRVQDARFQQLIVNYQNTVLRAGQEVEDALVAFLRAQEQARLFGLSVKAAQRSVNLSLIQYRDGAVDYNRVLSTQAFLVQEQDRLTAARGDIANSLIFLYRALGGGWELRQGNDFVPAETKQTMQERTDWGQLLEPEAVKETLPDNPQTSFRRPDW